MIFYVTFYHSIVFLVRMIRMKISLVFSLISICAVLLTCSGILKNDMRAKLALNWEVYEEKGNIIYEKVVARIGENIVEVEIPQLELYVNSGSIERAYFLFPYQSTEDEEDAYERFEAVHIRLNVKPNTKKWWPRKSTAPKVSLDRFEALCPDENNGSTYVMCILLGTDGSYHLIMLVYKNLLSGKGKLETFDRIDCLTYKEVYNSTYIEQFHKCVSYLKKNGITVI